MPTVNVIIGAPSLTGKAAKALVEAFAGATYPLAMKVTNLMPRQATFPEIGLFLNPHKNNSTTVEIANADLLQRFASSVEQIAELNRYKKAVELEANLEETPPVPAPTKKPAPKGKTEG